jgi:hypothetical protein
MSPGMKQECRRLRQSVDAIDGGLQCRSDVLVRIFAESNVAVADLDELQIAFRRLFAGDRLTARDAASQADQQTGTGPGHAVQEPAAVDAVVVVRRIGKKFAHDWLS